MKVSLVIAMYNTEKYIEKCIESAINSPLTFIDYEIIVINDGSTDDSRSIVENLMTKYSNIRLVNTENGGQSSARNIGFNLAQGEYIFCLDSDDYIDGVLFVEALNYAISNDLDMLPVQFVRVDESNKTYFIKDTYLKFEDVISGADFLNRFVIAGAMARYFYKTKIIKDNNLRLLEGIYHEDEEFVVKFLTQVKRIKYNQLAVYYYLDRHNSTVRNINIQHRKKLLFDIISVVDSLSSIIDNLEDQKLIKGVEKKKQQLILSVFLRMYKQQFDKKTVEEIINLLKCKKYYPLYSSQLNWKQVIVSKALNMSLINKFFLIKF